MPDSKLSSKTTTATTTGAFCYIIVPDGLGGYTSYRITPANLIKAATDAITALSTQVGGFTLTKYANQNTGFSITMGANTYFDRVFIRKVSGTPLVKIGTTVGGTELMEETTIQTGVDLPVLIQQSYPAETVIYITISGGTVNLTTNTITSIL